MFDTNSHAWEKNPVYDGLPLEKKLVQFQVRTDILAALQIQETPEQKIGLLLHFFDLTHALYLAQQSAVANMAKAEFSTCVENAKKAIAAFESTDPSTAWD